MSDQDRNSLMNAPGGRGDGYRQRRETGDQEGGLPARARPSDAAVGVIRRDPCSHQIRRSGTRRRVEMP